MIAFHGSPCLFDRFEAAKIGSQWRYGGAQGHGVYLAEDRDIAANYAVPGWRGGAAVRASNGRGYVYEIDAPDGEYIDTGIPCAEQPEPARSIFEKGFSSLKGPKAGYWRHVLDDAPNNTVYYSQVGKLLYFARKAGSPLEPILAAAGYIGCKGQVQVWGSSEFAIFEPSVLRILSVAEQKERMAA